MRPGRRLFILALGLLPARHRARIADEMLAVYDARMADAPHRAARVAVWLSEMRGLITAGYRLRGGSRSRVGAELLGDARFAWRTALRRPGLALLAVATCGVGIGGAAAMFSVVDGVLLRPLGFPDAERVVSIYPTIEEWRDHPSLGATWDRGSFSQAEFVDWRAEQTSFSEAALVSVGTRFLTGRGPAASVRTGFTTADLFRLAGVGALRGRLFDDSDGAPGQAPVAVVSRALWQSTLGGAEDVIGSTVRLMGAAYTVIGVLPDRFRRTGYEADVWLPLQTVVPEESERENHNFRAIGRLAPGVTIERAEAETARIMAGLSDHHDGRLTHRANVEARLEDMTRTVRAPLLVLLAGAALLLLAACANFAGLLLGSGLDRTTELAVRAALGAGRARVVRLLLTESVLLAAVGGAAGILLALALTQGLYMLAPAGVPRIDEVAVDTRAIAVASGLSLLAGLVFGAVPALVLGGDDVATRLRAARSVTRRRFRMHAALVVTQVALATVLLVAAGLLVRTLVHLDNVDPGFSSDRLVSVSVAPLNYRFVDDEGDFRIAAYAEYMDAIGTTLAGVPGVTDVAFSTLLPFSGGRANNSIEPEGYAPSPGEQLVAERAFVSGNYLDVISARLVEGRLLTPADNRVDAQPVMVVSRRLARRFWPDGTALGRTVSFWAGDFVIVGIVDDMHDRSLEADEDLRFYAPAKVAGQSGGGFVLRVRDDPARYSDVIRDHLAAFDADLPVTRVMPLAEMMGSTLGEKRFRARLLLCFAVLALFFAASGIYGAMSRRVALRRHEIGVRMALGAHRNGVLGNVLLEGVRLSFGGVVTGIALALAGSRLLGSWLSGVTPTDPVTYVVISAVLAATAALAALAPSVRAARVDPMDALRGE